MAEKANDEIMQMLNDRSGDSRKSRNRLNRRSQLGSNRIRAGLSQIRDPGGGGQNAHICDSLEISEGQSPDFIVLCQTLPTNPLHAASSGFYCFFPHSTTLSRFRTDVPPNTTTTSDPESSEAGSH